ncbi:MAG: hypothetical protein IIC52_05025 [Proteobacteria bacterium]|nr:hypothetical protein [Pseudomonadota bacterium]
MAPRYAAKLITSPSFVKWLTTPLTNPNGISAHLGRLVAIAVAEPELSEAIEAYTEALRSAPAGTPSQRSRATVRGIEGTPAEVVP